MAYRPAVAPADASCPSSATAAFSAARARTPALRSTPRASKPEQGCPDDRLARRDDDVSIRRQLSNGLGNRRDNAGRDRSQEATTQHHIGIRPGEVEPMYGSPRECDHLICQTSDDACGDRILAAGREYGRRQLD